MKKRTPSKNTFTCKHRWDEERGLDKNGQAKEGHHHSLLNQCFLRRTRTKCDNLSKTHKNCFWTKHYSQYNKDAR